MSHRQIVDETCSNSCLNDVYSLSWPFGLLQAERLSPAQTKQGDLR